MRPVPHAPDEPMLDRIEMEVVEVSLEILLIAQ
jgi:hypothetical protein